jgi:hypothetical protein
VLSGTGPETAERGGTSVDDDSILFPVCSWDLFRALPTGFFVIKTDNNRSLPIARRNCRYRRIDINVSHTEQRVGGAASFSLELHLQ